MGTPFEYGTQWKLVTHVTPYVYPNHISFNPYPFSLYSFKSLRIPLTEAMSEQLESMYKTVTFPSFGRLCVLSSVAHFTLIKALVDLLTQWASTPMHNSDVLPNNIEIYFKITLSIKHQTSYAK
jgi:hypothetical protein